MVSERVLLFWEAMTCSKNEGIGLRMRDRFGKASGSGRVHDESTQVLTRENGVFWRNRVVCQSTDRVKQLLIADRINNLRENKIFRLLSFVGFNSSFYGVRHLSGDEDGAWIGLL